MAPARQLAARIVFLDTMIGGGMSNVRLPFSTRCTAPQPAPPPAALRACRHTRNDGVRLHNLARVAEAAELLVSQLCGLSVMASRC